MLFLAFPSCSGRARTRPAPRDARAGRRGASYTPPNATAIVGIRFLCFETRFLIFVRKGPVGPSLLWAAARDFCLEVLGFSLRYKSPEISFLISVIGSEIFEWAPRGTGPDLWAPIFEILFSVFYYMLTSFWHFFLFLTL